MPRNVEIKARVASLEALEPRVAALADSGPEPILQDDTFFRCAHGRLKLRDFGDGRAELIAYDRPDTAGPKLSDYRITPSADPAGLREALARALGTIGRVRKRRTLYLAGATRIHLDRVERLGDYLELEVVLADSQSVADGQAQARQLLEHLGIEPEALIEGAYLDLLTAKDTA
jgi:adenylate cyclase